MQNLTIEKILNLYAKIKIFAVKIIYLNAKVEVFAIKMIDIDAKIELFAIKLIADFVFKLIKIDDSIIYIKIVLI